jgi:hypothetical protein
MEQLPSFVNKVVDGYAYMSAKAANAVILFYFNLNY